MSLWFTHVRLRHHFSQIRTLEFMTTDRGEYQVEVNGLASPPGNCYGTAIHLVLEWQSRPLHRFVLHSTIPVGEHQNHQLPPS